MFAFPPENVINCTIFILTICGWKFEIFQTFYDITVFNVTIHVSYDKKTAIPFTWG